MSGFSDPNWWPTPPPKPPKTVSTLTILLGTVVPVVVVAGIVFAILGPKSNHPKPVVGRSLAAFQSCLEDQGALTPSAESNDVMLRMAAASCRSHAPLVKSAKDRGVAVQAVLQTCLKAAQSSLRSGLGPFNAGSARNKFQQTTAICRAVAYAEAGGSGTVEPPPGPSSIA